MTSTAGPAAPPPWLRGEPTIDVHAHLAVSEVSTLLAGHPGFARQQRDDTASLGAVSTHYNQTQLAALSTALTDLDQRLMAMDRAGVDVQAVSPLPAPHAWADRQLAAKFVEATNMAVTRFCAQEPARLVPIGAVALQHPDLAVDQLTVGVQELGLRGVQISTSAQPGVELDHPCLAEFWSTAEQLDVAVLIHPWGCTLGERLDRYYLFNTVGNPVETALALSRLLMSGITERHRGLRLWSAHGGGYLPTYLGRADHAWHNRDDARTTTRPPSELLRSTFVDSLVYTPQQLRHLVEVMGPHQVTLGSDYPFDMGVIDPVERLLAAGFDPTTADALRSTNAIRLLSPAALRTP